MRVSEVMTTPVRTVEPESGIDAAARLMRDANVGSLPVVSGGRLLGMVTDRDLVVRVLAEGGSAQGMIVRDAMSSAVHCCAEDETVDAAVEVMRQHQVRRLVVRDRQERIVGIVSLHDLIDHRMASRPYMVTFYKRHATGAGHTRDAPLATIYVAPEHPDTEVVRIATERFAADFGIAEWGLLADRYEVTRPATGT